MTFDLETAATVAIPMGTALVIYGVRVEARLTRLETKLNLIMAYFHLEPKEEVK